MIEEIMQRTRNRAVGCELSIRRGNQAGILSSKMDATALRSQLKRLSLKSEPQTSRLFELCFEDREVTTKRLSLQNSSKQINSLQALLTSSSFSRNPLKLSI
mmetsp:Transcript_21096/g.41384  ORF Transcript_21096/g.41384 Transcript_21096/m.41384 type:complete len:102 (-) Transcript_21096:296-601(-)